MKNSIILVLILIITGCSSIQQKKDYSKFIHLGNFQDSVVKVSIYKDTLNYTSKNDTIAYIFVYEIVNDKQSILYKCNTMNSSIDGI